LQKRKIIAVVFVVAFVAITIVGYEFFAATSLSGYTKVSITTPNQPHSIKFSNTVQYNITFLLGLPTPSGGGVFGFRVSTDNSSKDFGATQGAKHIFSGLQIVVGNVSSDQLVLYVKPSRQTLRQ
jgi:hypothetical protein